MATGGGFGGFGGGQQGAGGLGGGAQGFGFGQQQPQQPGTQQQTPGAFSFGGGSTQASGTSAFGGFGGGNLGGAATGAPGFGQSPAPAPAPAFGGFGTSAAQQPGAAPTTAFGQAAPTTSFGQPASTSAFGQPAPTTTFSQPASFGTFGQTAPTSSPFGGFGAPSTGAAATPAPSTAFGQSGTTTTPFGQPAATTTTGGFGQSAPTSTFGQQQQPSTTPSFGFGAGASTQPGAPSAGNQATPSLGGFGGSTTPAPATPVAFGFGGAPSATPGLGGGFGATSTSTTAPTTPGLTQGGFGFGGGGASGGLGTAPAVGAATPSAFNFGGRGATATPGAGAATTTTGLSAFGQSGTQAVAPSTGAFSFGGGGTTSTATGQSPALGGFTGASTAGKPGTTPLPSLNLGGGATTGFGAAPAPAPSSGFSFGGTTTTPQQQPQAPGATTAASTGGQAPAPAPASTSFAFGTAPAQTSGAAKAPAPGAFGFGGAGATAAAPNTAASTATVPSLSVAFGGAAPAPSPAPAPAPAAPFSGLAGLGGAQPQTGAAPTGQQQQTQAPAPAPAAAPSTTSFGGAAGGGFQLGGAGGFLGAKGGAAGATATSGGADAPGTTGGGGGSGLSLFGGAASGGGPSGTGGGGGVFGGGKDAGGVFGSRGRRQANRAKINLQEVYSKLNDEPQHMNDREVSGAFDRLVLENHGPDGVMVIHIDDVLASPDFIQRATTMLAEKPEEGYYPPPSDQSRELFKRFENKQCRLSLLPGSKEVDTLPGDKEEVEAVRCLSKFLQLEEPKALHVLHAYQRDQWKRGFATEIDAREYSSLFFYERVRRFYFNQRVYLLKILQGMYPVMTGVVEQELFRIDQDREYFASKIKRRATEIVGKISTPAGALPRILKATVESLCRSPVPGVQDLNPQPTLRYRASPEWWERQRRDWVEQGIVELQEVLSIFVLALSSRVSLSLEQWLALVDSWYSLDLGALKPEKRYMLESGPVTKQRERHVSAMMMLLLIQAMQLDALQGTSYEEHPFIPGLRAATTKPLEGIIKAVHEKGASSGHHHIDHFSVLVLFWGCFIHLTEPLKRSLQQHVQSQWGEALEIFEKGSRKGGMAHLADIFRVLLDPPHSAAADNQAEDKRYTAKDIWAMVGVQTTLRRLADAEGRPAEWDRPDQDTLKFPMAEAIVAVLAACYHQSSKSRVKPMLGKERLVGVSLQFFVFLTAKVFSGSRSLCTIFWKSIAKESTPLSVLWKQAQASSPLLFFHLACAPAFDAVSAVKAVEELDKSRCITGFDPTFMIRQGREVHAIAPYFHRDLNIWIPAGQVQGVNEAAQGHPPKIQWNMTLWATMVRQLEAFINITYEFKIVRVVKKLDAMRDEALKGEGRTLGWNTIIDKFPSLFVFGPVSPSTDVFMEEVVQRGAWAIMAYCLGRVEMVLDQLALLVTLATQTSGADTAVLRGLSSAHGATLAGEQPLWKRLPICLLHLVQAASDAMGSQGSQHTEQAQALVTVQASALNLLEKLSRVDKNDDWRAEALRALVLEVEDKAPAVVAPRIPFIVWLGQRSIETERTLSQFRIARDAVRLMQNLIEQACGNSWAGKEHVLPLEAADSFIIRLVDFTSRVLLTLDTWTFARNLDRWLLARACVQTLSAFLQPSFKSEDPASRVLEAHRHGVLRRFRHDRVLFRSLLRCIEHVPLSALQASLDARARRRPPFRFLDQLQPDHDDEDEQEGEEGRGLFLSQDAVLPLRFDQGVVAMAPADERQLLDQLGVESLDLLNLVLDHYVQDEEDKVAGALELLLKTPDLSLPKTSTTRWAGARRPLASHAALLASLVSYRSRKVEGARSLAEVSLSTMSHLTKFMRKLHRRKKEELEKAITCWPQGLPLPFYPGVIEEMLSVTNAHGFRKALLETLPDVNTPPEVVMAGLDFMVDAMNYQPSLARHLLFSRRSSQAGGGGAAAQQGGAKQGTDITMENVILHMLDRGKELIERSDAEEDELAWPFMAMVCRTLYVILRAVSWRQSLDFMAGLDDRVWTLLSDAVGREVGDSRDLSIAQFNDYCAMLSVQRYALDTFAWAAAIAASSDTGSLADAAKKKACKAVRTLAKSRLLSDPAMLRQSIDSSFRAADVEAEQRAAEKAGLRRLHRFRLPDWEEQLKDANPRRFGESGFVYDLAAVKRALHGGGESGKGRSRNDVLRIENAVRALNRRYSAAAAKHMVNKSFKAVVQILVIRLSSVSALQDLNIANLGLNVLTLLLDSFQQHNSMLLSGGQAADLGFEDLNLSDPYWTEHKRRERRAERLDLIRRLRQPKLELLLTLVTTYEHKLTSDLAKTVLVVIEQAFNQLINEGVDPLSSEALQLDLRQCLLSSALRILACRALRENRNKEPPAKVASALLRHAVASISLLDTSLIGEQAAASTFHSEKVECVLTSSVTLVGEMLPDYWGDQRKGPEDKKAKAGAGGQEERKGDDSGPDDFSDLERAEAEALIVEEVRSGEVMRRVLMHYTSASALAAKAFATLHDYTAIEVGRTIAVAELKADPHLERARRRLICLMRFMLTCATKSPLLCRELINAHVLNMIAEDPIFTLIAETLEGSGARMAKDLLYKRGYMADGEESPYYSLWVNAIRLVAVLLHRLTRPYMEDGAALPPALSSRHLSTLMAPRAQDDTENKILAEVMALVGRRKRLLLWPIGEGKMLTMALLREADAVMVLVREMGIHMHTWRTNDIHGFEALRETVKSLVFRSATLLGRFLVAERGVVLPVIEEAFFVTVSKAENKAKSRWRELRENGKPPESNDPEASVEDSFVRILASAMAFLRYTGPLRLPRWIPLTPGEAEHTSFAEGTRVLYLDSTGMTRSEGVILERRLEYRYREEHLVGTYTIEPSDDPGMYEAGVQPSRIIAVEDNQYLERAANDLEFELPEVNTGLPSSNIGRLSVARIITLTKFAIAGLQSLANGDGRSEDEKVHRRAYLQKVLEHSLFLLLQVTPGMCRQSSASKKDRQTLVAHVAEVVDFAVEWRWPGHGGKGKKEAVEQEEEVNQRLLEELKRLLMDDADRCLKKDHLSDAEMIALDKHLVKCGKARDLLDLGIRCVELRQHKRDQISLRTYGAVLHACVEAGSYVRAVGVVEEMIKDSLTRVVGEVKSP